MNLYERDYTKLTPEEEAEYKRLNAIEDENLYNFKLISNKPHFYDYPKAVRHFQQLFPNNYIDCFELQDVEKLKNQLKDFETLLSKNVGEREILNFIKINEAYFIIASLLKKYFDFGHHEANFFQNLNLVILTK